MSKKLNENYSNETNDLVPENIELVEQKQEKQPSRAPFVVMGIMMSAMMVALIVLICITLNMTKANSKSIDELKNSNVASDGNAEQIASLTKEVETLNSSISELMALVNLGEDVAQEDDINIAGGYRIRSTKEISDAYISGDTSSLNGDQKKCLELASKVLDEIIEEGMTDYEKELAVYTWIRDNIKHDDGVTVLIPNPTKAVDTPLGVLSGKKAVCVGYATTFRLLTNMLGFECKVVHDTSLVHSWDEIKLDDGWYMVDIYSDAETNSFANFNMNYEKAIESHDWNTDFFPTVDGSKYIYGRMSADQFVDFKTLATEYRELVENPNGGSHYVLFTGEDAESNAYIANELASQAASYFSNSELCENGYVDCKLSIIDEGEYLVSFDVVIYNYDDDDPEEELDYDEDEYEKAIEELEKVFKDFYDDHTYQEYYDDYEWGANSVG